MKFNIAIDGPSAAGKSTIADKLACKYKLTHLDTGSMYRAVALQVLKENIASDNQEAICDLLPNIAISFDLEGDIYLNNENITDKIGKEEISWLASTISRYSCVREFLVSQQQAISEEKGYVLDGRDIGTVVLPQAEVKIFLTATPESRAERRYLEYLSKGIDCSYETVLADIKKRDKQDTTRKNSPLRKADDAIELDSSYLSIDEVIEYIDRIISKKVVDICD